MNDTIGSILGLARALLDGADRLTAAQSPHRAELAHVFDQLSGCLTGLSCTLRRGETSSSFRTALLFWLQSASTVLSDVVTDSGAEALLKDLITELSAPAASDTWTREVDGDNLILVDQIEDAAGKFRTLAAMARWYLDSRYNVFVRPNEVEAEALARLGARLGLRAEDLVHAALLELLQTTPEFKAAVAYVIQKNRALHQRLR